MFPKLIGKSLIVIPLVLSLASCTALNNPIVHPPAPKLLPAIPNPPSPAQESSISVPVHVDLSPFLAAANDDSVIPKKFDHWGSFIRHPKGTEYKYYAERDDFSLVPSGAHQANGSQSGLSLHDWWKGIELSSSHIFIGTALRYKIGASSLHCGDGNDWPRRGTVHGSIATELTPTYGLSASVASVAVNPSDPCQIRVADLDVAQEVRQRLTDLVRGGLSRTVSRINTLTVKSHVEDAWNTLRGPIKLEPDAWLQFNIDKVRHSGFSGAGPMVNDTIHITAKPVIIFGQEPPAGGAALPHLILHRLLQDSMAPPTPSSIVRFPRHLRIGSLQRDSTSSRISPWTTPHSPRVLRTGSQENRSRRKGISLPLPMPRSLAMGATKWWCELISRETQSVTCILSENQK